MSVDRFPVEEGSILLFRRSIGDPNPDAAIPPLTYVQAGAQFDSDYPLRPKPGEKWFGSGKEASGTAGTGGGDGSVTLHAEQHFEYHRRYGVGDVLSATTRPGDTWEKEGRSGTLVFTEYVTDFVNGDGDLVVTARGVSVTTYRNEA